MKLKFTQYPPNIYLGLFCKKIFFFKMAAILSNDVIFRTGVNKNTKNFGSNIIILYPIGQTNSYN